MSYENDGLTSRTHGNCNCRPHNGFTTHELIYTVTYIKNYAEANGILLPGRIPGFKRMDIQLLPTQQPNNQSGWSTLRPVGLLIFALWVTTASVKFGESFSLTLSIPVMILREQKCIPHVVNKKCSFGYAKCKKKFGWTAHVSA